MKKIITFLILAFVIALIISFITGCSDVKVEDRLVNPIPLGATGKWSGVWVLYDDELKTGGGIMFYTEPNPENPTSQTLNVSYTEENGNKCMKYSWDGDISYDSTWKVWQDKWCGMALIVGKDWTEVQTSTKDLSLAGYKKISFKIKGHLSESTRIKIDTLVRIGKFSSYPAASVVINSLSDQWEEYTLVLNNVSTINIFFSLVIENKSNTKSQGAVVYLDDIILTQ
jgi:hypothetical protein